jgi:hypothetical protein
MIERFIYGCVYVFIGDVMELENPLVKRMIERLKSEGLDPNDKRCPALNIICESREKKGKCRYTRLQRALMFFDCAFER